MSEKQPKTETESTPTAAIEKAEGDDNKLEERQDQLRATSESVLSKRDETNADEYDEEENAAPILHLIKTKRTLIRALCIKRLQNILSVSKKKKKTEMKIKGGKKEKTTTKKKGKDKMEKMNKKKNMKKRAKMKTQKKKKDRKKKKKMDKTVMTKKTSETEKKKEMMKKKEMVTISKEMLEKKKMEDMQRRKEILIKKKVIEKKKQRKKMEKEKRKIEQEKKKKRMERKLKELEEKKKKEMLLKQTLKKIMDSMEKKDLLKTKKKKKKKVRSKKKDEMKKRKKKGSRDKFQSKLKRKEEKIVKKRGIKGRRKIKEDKKWREVQKKTITFSVVRELNVRPNKYTENLNRNIKMTKNMERPYLITEGNVDHTPNQFIKPGDPMWLTNPLLFTFPCEKIRKYKPEDLLRHYPGKSSTKANLTLRRKFSKPKTISEDNMATTDTSGDEDALSCKAPSMFHLVYPQPEPLNKRKLSFKLTETEMIVLLDLKSQAADIGDEEGLVIEKENEFQTELKRRLKKTVENYTQTTMMKTPNRDKQTYIPRLPRANKYTYISNWIFEDTMDEVREKPPLKRERRMVGKVDKIVYAELKTVAEPLIATNLKISDRRKWFRTGLVMERLLLSNNAFDRQLVFHDLLRSSPMSEDVNFKYRLQRLWTWKTKDTKGKTVTSMSWNFFEKNILAVGYGKYNFSDKTKGLILIWNNKNLANPEREYHFEHPVTSVRFSKVYPAVLAIGFYSGMVMIINIIRHYGIKVVAQNIPSDRTLVYPVWQVAWVKKESSLPNKVVERILECRGDGCVYKYTRGHIYEKKMIIRISKMKGFVKGISYLKKPEPYVIPLVRHPAILCIELHPEKPSVYYIGSDEGAVYKCTLQDVNQHLDMFLAHNGPVYTIQFHPACCKIFLTCGADWYVRVWAEGIYVPLITMISGMSAVQSARWCPNCPTVIASITDTKIELWDIARKINFPQATVENPFKNKNTSMAFSRCGNNLCVADDDGNVFVYGFRDMPFTPMYQDMVLALALLKALIPRPALLIELQKLGTPFTVHRIYRNLINLPF